MKCATATYIVSPQSGFYSVCENFQKFASDRAGADQSRDLAWTNQIFLAIEIDPSGTEMSHVLACGVL